MTPRHLLPACLLACDPVGPRVLSGDHIDIVLDPSNPGEWMAHCHIAEHLTSGMMIGFTVTPKP